VHLHDWTGGLVPLFLRHGLHGTGRTARERTVFTIHNLAYQGLFPAADFGLTNLPFSCFSVPVMEFYGRINCMKAGIASSDLVTTVSGRYAGDIRTPEYGCGLDGVLQLLGDRLKGIQNGVDEDTWNPAADRFLVTGYDANRPAGKAANKRQLLGQLGWDGASAMRRPLVGMVARLVDQKGLNILAEAMPEMMKRDIGFVLLGSGDSAHEAMAQEWARSWPDRFHTRIGYDQVLAHRIQAASDLFLMPSRHEPCGLSQLYAMRYGTLPVVHATGGLDDTVRDLDESPADGNGIKFREYTAAAMLAAVDRALAVLSDSSRRGAVIRRIMSEDHSWARSAREYADLYARLSRPA
jgi:starch synthase